MSGIRCATTADLSHPVIIRSKLSSSPSQKSIAIINTGGTIGMKPDESGSLQVCPGYLAERILGMSEFGREEVPATTLFELLPLLDSSDMQPEDWLRIACSIRDLYDQFDGFVIIMGTDTMSYCASALSFLCEHLGKPVVLTGAMLPLVSLCNDAQRNLLVSVVLASTLSIPEVCVFMDNKLMRGNRTVKLNSSGLDAFDSPNYPPLAHLEVGVRLNPSLLLPPPRPGAPFRIHRALHTCVAVWRMIPGFDDGYMMKSLDTEGLRAIVLELYGTGNAGSRKKSFLEAITRACALDIIVVAASQCVRGTVDLGAYALGKSLACSGVVPGGDMTTETIAIKLAYLLSFPGITNEEVKRFMSVDLRGEISESSRYIRSTTAAVTAATATATATTTVTTTVEAVTASLSSTGTKAGASVSVGGGVTKFEAVASLHSNTSSSSSTSYLQSASSRALEETIRYGSYSSSSSSSSSSDAAVSSLKGGRLDEHGGEAKSSDAPPPSTSPLSSSGSTTDASSSSSGSSSGGSCSNSSSSSSSSSSANSTWIPVDDALSRRRPGHHHECIFTMDSLQSAMKVGRSVLLHSDTAGSSL